MAFIDFEKAIKEKIDFREMEEDSVSEIINKWYIEYVDNPFIVGYYSFVDEWFPEDEFSEDNKDYEFHLKNIK